MAKQLNSAGASHAASLIGSGKIADDKSWSAPSAAEETAYFEKNGASEYGKFFLGLDPDVDKTTKSHWSYPYSASFETVSIRGLRAIISRAGQAGAKAIEDRASELYEAAKKKLGKDKERTESKVTKILVRKAGERMARNEVLTAATTAAGYTSNDLMRWLGNELDDVKPEGFGEKDYCYLFPVNLILPEHEKGETWQVVCVGPEQKLYCVDFTLGEAGVTIVGTPKPVVPKDQYVLLDEMLEEADDEANGRTDKSGRKCKAGRMYRSFEVDENDVDDANQEISVSFASELPGLQRCGGFDGREMPTECERSAGLKSGEVYVEILDHNPDNVDHSVLNNSGAVLDEHDEKDHLGVVKPGTSRTDKGTRVSRARLKLDDHEKGKMRFRQMKSGSRPHLSAGYKHSRYIGKEILPNGRVAHRFAWTGLEISSVAVPLDGTIGAGRAGGVPLCRAMGWNELPTVDSEYNNKSSDKNADTKEKSMTPEEIKAAKDAEDARVKAAEDKARAETEAKVRKEMEEKVTSASTTGVNDGCAKEKKRFTEIYAVRDELITCRKDQAKSISALADAAMKDGTSAVDFKARASAELIKLPAPANGMTELGYDEQDQKHYSLVRGVQNIIARSKDRPGVTEPDPDTIEGDASVKLRKRMEQAGGCHQDQLNGFLVPHNANLNQRSLSRSERRKMQRDQTMQATVFGQGGATVATELILPVIELLRNEMVTPGLGITELNGLEGNIAIPRQTAASTVNALPETGALVLSGQVLDQIALTPHKVGAWNGYSRQLLLQSSMDVENFIRTDMFAVIALAWDRYIITGQGAGDEPTGILNQQGILLVNGTGIFSGITLDPAAPSWADIVNFETQIAAVNARQMGRAWATTSTAKGRLKTIAKLFAGATTVAAMPLWEGGKDGEGEMNGYLAKDSQQVPNNYLIFGVWPTVIHALWGGLSIIVDPYTMAKNGIVNIYMDTFGDVAMRHPQEFCCSLNSAAA